MTKDEKGNDIPYGPYRFKQIVQERYLISQVINTSYNDIGLITPLERKYLLEFKLEEIKKEKELREKQKAQQKR